MESDKENFCTDQENTTPRLAERRTGLRGLLIGAVPPAAGRVRKNTEGDLRERDPEIPYWKFEAALRDLVCSLMERQDRMNEELLQRIVDLQYRMDDHEAARSAKPKKPCGAPEAPL